MIKFLMYVVIFFVIGYNYAIITKGTIFDHFLIMLLTLFVIIFLVEWLFSMIRKRKIRKSKVRNQNTQMEENAESAEEQSLVDLMQELKTEFHKTWEIPYKDYHIKIVNQYNEEQLYINDTLVDSRKRTSWYSFLIPFQSLKALIEVDHQPMDIKVKLGGLVSLQCKVYINKKLVFKEKIKYDWLSGTIKEKD
ncbi:hypothetical protein BpOF4_17740 [Alkalihalophilus pseudofirmus OF4]|uniref:Uncharacterized protein n=1 Tax=Alkalihalophilus pseudofirmus (strain ATCC BAA-2126 / JCM 17055 / OF4) TaxID=398511 RepID=D3FRJ8_ALKPO|nr:hypothetical protein [Alkalihalophilus pseudofirmus]ADC51589.1 hypothetical protein BpOF4_17740 [Alkalihalophilus pseudofirmus OF4]